MLRIYFVRHGETEWNTLKVFQGSSDSPLTQLGIEQAKKLGNSLENTEFLKVYSSPQGRALKTAGYIFENKNMDIIKIEEFKEISMGSVEGIKKEEFEKNYPEEYHSFWNEPENYNPSKYGGESYDEIFKRVRNGLDKILNENNGVNGNILVVSHGVTLKALFSIINNKGIEEFKNQGVPSNTSVTIIGYSDDNFVIEKFSDTTHLN